MERQPAITLAAALLLGRTMSTMSGVVYKRCVALVGRPIRSRGRCCTLGLHTLATASTRVVAYPTRRVDSPAPSDYLVQ